MRARGFAAPIPGSSRRELTLCLPEATPAGASYPSPECLKHRLAKARPFCRKTGSTGPRDNSDNYGASVLSFLSYSCTRLCAVYCFC